MLDSNFDHVLCFFHFQLQLQLLLWLRHCSRWKMQHSSSYLYQHLDQDVNYRQQYS